MTDYQRLLDQQERKRAAAREGPTIYVRTYVKELARVLRRQGWNEEQVREEVLRLVDEGLVPPGDRLPRPERGESE